MTSMNTPWIPVGERLPEHSGEYPVVIGWNHAITNAFYNRQMKRFFINNEQVNVSHWYQLPPAPKAKTQEEVDQEAFYTWRRGCLHGGLSEVWCAALKWERSSRKEGV